MTDRQPNICLCCYVDFFFFFPLIAAVVVAVAAVVPIGVAVCLTNFPLAIINVDAVIVDFLGGNAFGLVLKFRFLEVVV